MNIRKAKQISENLLSFSVLLTAAAVIRQCLGLYRAGTAPENFTPEGVRIRDIFTPELVIGSLREILWVFLLLLTCLIPAMVLRTVCPEERAMASNLRRIPVPAPGHPVLRRVLRKILLVAAVLLVILGIANGGMRDVLYKAINICTECVGLG